MSNTELNASERQELVNVLHREKEAEARLTQAQEEYSRAKGAANHVRQKLEDKYGVSLERLLDNAEEGEV